VGGAFPQPKIIEKRCNIAEGRNLAIRNTDSEIIVSIDAGSVADPHWLEEMVKPFRDHADVGVVGGWCPTVATNPFQKQLAYYYAEKRDRLPVGGNCNPSSRNVAFRRTAWLAVGQYPEWLTLTAEDALFNFNLHHAGIRFYYQPSAIVSWEVRTDMRSYRKMMWTYGYGSAEAREGTAQYIAWLLSTVFPFLILFSRHPISHLPIRFSRNAWASIGWVTGKLRGKKPPAGWRAIKGGWLSPETVATIAKHSGTAK